MCVGGVSVGALEASGIRSPGFEITGHCESSDMDAGSQTWEFFVRAADVFDYWAISPAADEGRIVSFCGRHSLCSSGWPGIHYVTM